MSDDIVLDYYDCLLRKSDVNLLKESCWINDNLIAFAFEYDVGHPLPIVVNGYGSNVTCDRESTGETDEIG